MLFDGKLQKLLKLW